MFGMGFMEIMIVAIIAVIFLGPDKLPEALVNIAKFFRSFKNTLSDAKNSIEQEMNISELKQEALAYKNELTTASSEIERIKDMANLDLPDLTEEFKPGISPVPTAKEGEPKEEVTFKKKEKKKKKKEANEATPLENTEPQETPKNESEDK